MKNLVFALILGFTSISIGFSQEEVFTVVEESPEFPGGQDKLYEYIRENIEYPEESIENGIEGRVYVEFIVEKNGDITNIKVIRGVDKLLDKEAERVVKSMPNWVPGKQSGKVVRVKYVLPIFYALSDEEEK